MILFGVHEIGNKAASEAVSILVLSLRRKVGRAMPADVTLYQSESQVVPSTCASRASGDPVVRVPRFPVVDRSHAWTCRIPTLHASTGQALQTFAHSVVLTWAATYYNPQ